MDFFVDRNEYAVRIGYPFALPNAEGQYNEIEAGRR